MSDYSDTAPLLEWLRQPRWMEGNKQKRLFEAADEIERLREENRKLRAEVSRSSYHCD